MNPALYVIKKDGKVMVDNSALSKEVTDYIASINQKPDIVDLMKMVKDDQEKCASQDETFRVFYERLTVNQSGSSNETQKSTGETGTQEATTETK